MKTVRQQRAMNKVVLLDNERVHAGVDVHKRNYHVGLWSESRELLTTWIQPASYAVLAERLLASGAIVQVVYEAGPTGFGLARYLRARDLNTQVIAPSQVPSLPGTQPKTDRLDCSKLARLAAKGLLRAVHVPSECEEADRQVVRLREQLVRKVRRTKHQIKSFLLQHGIAEPHGLKDWTLSAIGQLRKTELTAELRLCLDALLDELDWLTAQRNKATLQVRALARSERHRHAVAILNSAPGVGLITAMTVRTELLEPRRFNNAQEIARLIGLAPSVHQSGNSQKPGHLMKAGNARIRAVLVEAAWRQIRLDEHARRRFNRLLCNTADSKKAIVAVARHLAICLWRMLTRDEPYRRAAV